MNFMHDPRATGHERQNQNQNLVGSFFLRKCCACRNVACCNSPLQILILIGVIFLLQSSKLSQSHIIWNFCSSDPRTTQNFESIWYPVRHVCVFLLFNLREKTTPTSISGRDTHTHTHSLVPASRVRVELKVQLSLSCPRGVHLY